MDTPCCVLCGAVLPRRGRRVPDRRSLVVCSSCGLAHLLPTLDVAAGIADLDAYAASVQHHKPRFAAHNAALLDDLERLAPGRALFEIGAALGWLIDAALARGFAAQGLEPAGLSPHIRSAAADAVIERATLEDSRARGPFHAVVMTQVIEHLVDPVAALRWVRERLHPGGVLFVETPNLNALSRHLRVPSWEAANLGSGHQHLFTARTLRAACERAGLVVVETRSYMKALGVRRGQRAVRVLNAVLAPARLGNNLAVFARRPET